MYMCVCVCINPCGDTFTLILWETNRLQPFTWVSTTSGHLFCFICGMCSTLHKPDSRLVIDLTIDWSKDTYYTDSLKGREISNLESAAEGARPPLQNSYHLRVGDVNKIQACFNRLYWDELPVCLSELETQREWVKKRNSLFALLNWVADTNTGTVVWFECRGRAAQIKQ